MEPQFPTSQNSHFATNNAELNSTTVWIGSCILETVSLRTIAIFGVIICLFVFVLYSLNSSLRTSANTFVLSLITSDCLRSIFLLLFYATFSKKWMPGDVWCKPFSFLSLCFNITSVLSILLITRDRYCAVKDPLYYMRSNSKNRARILVTCTWLFSFSLAVPVIFGFFEFEYNTCDIKISSTRSIFNLSVIYEGTIILTSFILPFIIVTYLYYGMCKAAKNSADRCESNSCRILGSRDAAVNMKPRSTTGDSKYGLESHLHILEGEHSQEKNCFLNKNRAAITALLAVLSFIIFWSPYFIVRFYQQFKQVTIQVKFWAQFPTFLSSVVDPYVYFYRNYSTFNYIRHLLARLFHGCKASMDFQCSLPQSLISEQSLEDRLFYHFPKTE